MPHYMTQFTYTSDGWKTLVRNPHDRTEAFRALLEKLGGKLLFHFFSFGEYDSVLIAEAPNEITMTSVLLAVIAEGDIKEMKTTVLIDPALGVEAMRKARGAGFRPGIG